MRRGRVFKRCGKCSARTDEKVCPRCGSKSVSWVFVVDVAALGEPRRQRFQAGFRTKSDAITALNRVLVDVEERRYIQPDRAATVDGYVREWLKGAKASVRPSTWDSYRTNLELHVLPAIGAVPLQHLTTERVNALYAELATEGRTDGRGGLSSKTVRNVHVAIRKALADAVQSGRLGRNPADGAKLPRVERVEMKTWTAVELGRFLEFVKDDPMHAAWMVAAGTGMRRGELLGLRWRDVDLAAARAAIQQTLVSVAYEIQFSKPKTNRGRRSVPLSRPVVAALLDHQLRQSSERNLMAHAYADLDLVFARPDGSPTHPQVFSDTFERLVRRSGLPVIRFHDIRHTFATLALQSGSAPKVISDVLGHSTVAFTMDVYSHAIPQMQEATVEAFAELVLGR